MGILDGLKAAFPKPRIPQKRYLVILGLIVYAGLKVYVTLTPDPNDDQLPDKLRVMFLDLAADDSLDQNGISADGSETVET